MSCYRCLRNYCLDIEPITMYYIKNQIDVKAEPFCQRIIALLLNYAKILWWILKLKLEKRKIPFGFKQLVKKQQPFWNHRMCCTFLELINMCFQYITLSEYGRYFWQVLELSYRKYEFKSKLKIAPTIKERNGNEL